MSILWSRHCRAGRVFVEGRRATNGGPRRLDPPYKNLSEPLLPMAKLSQPPSLAQRWQASIEDHVIALAWSPDGATLAAASISGPIVLYNSADGSVTHALKGHGFGTTSLSWQPGGQLLASSGQDGKVRLWDTASGDEIQRP